MSSAFQYGGYVHPDFEVNLANYTVQTRISPRGKMLSRIYRLHLEGEVLGESSEITTRLNGILTAYYQQNQDAKFYVNGALTPHYAFNSNSISGVKVMGISHPVADAAEYAVKRTIHIDLQSEQEDPESQLVDWQETVRWVGNTGPREEWFQGLIRPRKQRLCLATVQQIIQSGSSIGWAGYVLPPGPLLPLSEHQEQRQVELGTPKSFGQALRLYPCQWTYTHAMSNYTEISPNIR